MPFKAKEVPRSVKESRLLHMQAETEARKLVARHAAQEKLERVNSAFAQAQGRVAGAMEAARSPFVGTVDENIMCMSRNCTCCNLWRAGLCRRTR